MTGRSENLVALSETIADYRTNEIPPRSPELIEQWLGQFPPEIQDAVLEALLHVLTRTYISREKFGTFLKGLASTERLSPGTDPSEYWRGVNLLNIQQGGSSQHETLAMFDEVLREAHGFGVAQTGSQNGDFIYLDDCIATGSRLRSDVCNWLNGNTPVNINLHVITPILFSGSWWVDERIQEEAKKEGKTIVVKKWRIPEFNMENRLRYRNTSDVLWPCSIPDNESVQQYCQLLEELGHPPVLRYPGNSGASGIFATDEEMRLLEEALLIRGSVIIREQVNLPGNLRPLGYSNLDTLGFGSMFVTYRNCPNNCPLALRIEQDDFPALFPRKTNAEVFDEEDFF